MIGLIHPERPDYVSIETWERLNGKEQDYLYLVSMKHKVAKRDIMRMLYFRSDWGMEKFRRRLMDKLYTN